MLTDDTAVMLPSMKRFLVIKAAPASTEGAPVIEVVLNWFEELKAKVPVGR